MNENKLPNPDPTLESIEAQLRALSHWPSPSPELKARLYDAIPAIPPQSLAFESPTRKPLRSFIWFAAASAFAAACYLTVFVWPEPGDKSLFAKSESEPEHHPSRSTNTASTSGNSEEITPWLRTRLGFDEDDRPDFIWPIKENFPLMVSNVISFNRIE